MADDWPIESGIPGSKDEGVKGTEDSVYIAPGEQDKYDRNRPTDEDRVDEGFGMKDRYKIVNKRMKRDRSGTGIWWMIGALLLLNRGKR